RTSWRTPLGGIPAELMEPNTRKWSGDHAASDVADTPGVILASRRLVADDPAIVDLAPTTLAFFGVPVPPEMRGHRLLAAARWVGCGRSGRASPGVSWPAPSWVPPRRSACGSTRTGPASFRRSGGR